MEKLLSSNSKNSIQLPFFVYGTLMQNFRNHNHMFKNFKFLKIQEAVLEYVSLYHFEMGFPGVYESENKGDVVKGELISLDKIEKFMYENLVKNLDYLEGFIEEKKPDYDYLRKVCKVRVIKEDMSSEYIDAWVYFCNLDLNIYPNKKVECGDWKKFMHKERIKNGNDKIIEDDSGPAKYAF